MRRTQRVVRGYRDGGAVLDPPLPSADAVPAAESLDPSPPPEAAEPHESELQLSPEELAEKQRNDQAVVNAVNGQRAAEQRAAELAKMSPAERALAEANPWMMPTERWFILKNGQALFSPENIKHAEAAWNEAVESGIERGSQSFFNFIMRKVARGREVGEAAERLDRDVERERLTSAASEPAPVPVAPEGAATGGAIPAPARSMPMAAPVQREAPMMSGRPRSESNRLSPEERDTAHKSIPDRPDLPRLTNAQKEYMYLQNREKYQKMLRDGTYTSERQR